MTAADRNTILYVGLNPGAAAEAQGLRGFGPKVLFIGNSAKPDWISVGGKAYDLGSADGRMALVRALKLTEIQKNIVVTVLTNAYRNTRDELGKLAARWAMSEHGGVTPNRMVISSHHAGTGEFWGDKNGVFTFDEVKRLASAFPRAAGAIEHLHFSACYSALRMMEWTSVFTNLQTIWAYGGSAPGSASGAMVHLRIWERATRGTRIQLHRAGAKNTRKGGNVTVWSRGYGIEEETVESIETLRARETADRHVFDEFFAGDQVVVDTDSGPLRDYYNTVQSLLNHVELPSGERPELERKREKTIRLIFYQKEIRRKFQETYAKDLSAGFQALHLTVPNFATMNRKPALTIIEDFKSKAGASPAASAKQCLRLLEGLRELDPQIIPVNWI